MPKHLPEEEGYFKIAEETRLSAELDEDGNPIIAEDDEGLEDGAEQPA